MKFKKTIIASSIILAVAGIAAIPLTFIHLPRTENVVKDPVVVNESKMKLKDGKKTSFDVKGMVEAFSWEINEFVEIQNFPEDTKFHIEELNYEDNEYLIKIGFDKFFFGDKEYKNKYGFNFEVKLPYEKMEELEIEEGVIKGINPLFKESVEFKYWDGVLEIPETYNGFDVVEIADKAFWFEKKIRTIDWGTNCKIEKIGTEAFELTSGLDTDLKIPSSVVEIEKEAFNNSGLKSIRFERNGNLNSIGEKAFSWIFGLRGNVVLPDGIEYVGMNAFAYTGLDGLVYIPDGFKPEERNIFGTGEDVVELSLWGEEKDWGKFTFNTVFGDGWRDKVVYRK
ncbi:MAG: leucine-rich repeat domain-containing protein [Mycoplasma sp.]